MSHRLEWCNQVRQRANRVLVNGTTSGSARRIAQDAIDMANAYELALAAAEDLRTQIKEMDEKFLFSMLDNQ